MSPLSTMPLIISFWPSVNVTPTLQSAPIPAIGSLSAFPIKTVAFGIS